METAYSVQHTLRYSIEAQITGERSTLHVEADDVTSAALAAAGLHAFGAFDVQVWDNVTGSLCRGLTIAANI